MSIYVLSTKFQKEIRAGARAMKKKIANSKRQERAKRIVSKKLDVILRRKIREAKKQEKQANAQLRQQIRAQKQLKKPVKVVKQYRPRRTKAEIQIAVMKKELDRRANFEKKFAEKFGLSKSALRQCRRIALA